MDREMGKIEVLFRRQISFLSRECSKVLNLLVFLFGIVYIELIIFIFYTIFYICIDFNSIYPIINS